jgi:hypothetical protein
MLSVRVGDTIAPAGLYASDRDMFVFLVDDQHCLRNPADPDVPLARGFMLWNSEVGDKSVGGCAFLYDSVCGNHIVWGARDLQEFRIRHVGQARGKAFSKLRVDLARYAESSVSDEQAKIERAQSYELGATKEEVIDTLMGFVAKKKLAVLKRPLLEEAYDTALEADRYGNPRTPWAVAQGVTQLSQGKEYASTRVDMDVAAGKLMSIAF